VVELIAGFIYVSIHRSVFLKDWIGMEITEKETRQFPPAPVPEVLGLPREFESMRESVTEESGPAAFHWICRQMDITDPKNLVVSTNTRFNIINYPAGYFTGLVNLEKINNLRRINKFFETVNAKLPHQGIFIGCVETYGLRKQRIFSEYIPGVNYLIYSADFIIHRVFPKLAFTRKTYFFVTRGKRRMLSRTEAIGRLYSCGFEVLEETTIGGLLYWKARKTGPPLMDDTSYGIFIRLRRVGRHGNEFNVYKLRTMHAYAEYIQKYVYETNKLGEGGKFRDDFRVSGLGRVLRKFWLDEIPMLLNVVKGDMKIVGVRPLSKHYFSLYTEELQQKRIRFRPGLIPPYYAQFPTPVTLEDVQRNELEYLAACEKHPLTTDVKYFFKALYNIVWRRARSK
jgi:lipopolysaccharide/colanic/teichoic acid biosynthesis glycosyltransferase